MYSKIIAINLIRIGHLARCRIELIPKQTNTYQITLIAQEGQGGDEDVLEDGIGRPMIFRSVSEAMRMAQSLGFADDSIERKVS